MVDEFREQIRAAWQPFDMKALLAIDYCQLVKSPTE
jgi:hypothetical protein